ncbi:MAG TPA: hypothetical protein VFF77_02315 [Holophagaceae bacterium]|nr:hypothetical protein [Holophagaceae bacterium]
MAASKTRIDWALLLLRIVVGAGLLLHALPELRSGGASFHHAAQLGGALAEAIGGVLVLIGLFQPIVCLVMVILLAIPLVDGWIHGAAIFGHLDLLLRIFTVGACGLGGPGKWGLGKG